MHILTQQIFVFQTRIALFVNSFEAYENDVNMAPKVAL